MQWIVINPITAEGIVTSPKKPLIGTYEQVLEWAGLLQLRNEVRRAQGGDKELNAIYITACEHYCEKWGILAKEPAEEPTEPKVE